MCSSPILAKVGRRTSVGTRFLHKRPSMLSISLQLPRRQGHNRYSYDEEGEREETGGGDGEDDEDEDEEDKDEENEDEEDEDGDGIHDSKRSFWHSVARTYPTSRGASRKPKWIIVADTELSYICSEVRATPRFSLGGRYVICAVYTMYELTVQ